METPREELAKALRKRLAIIADGRSRQDPPAHMAKLKTVSEEIERLGASLPHPVDPRLKHFLERRSYDKALELLDASG
jgi:hypothetical protein